jgi:hypothetical protein
MRPFSDILPFVLPFAPSVPEPTAIHYIRQATIAFCQRTRVWRYVDQFTAIGSPTEIISVPPQSSMFEIERAWFKPTTSGNWIELKSIPYSKIDQVFIDEELNSSQTPNYISQIEYNTVGLTPPATGDLRISMFLIPSNNAQYCGEDFIFDNYSITIANGALSDILTIPEQPYTNPALAGMKRQLFNQECDGASTINIRGQQRAPIRARSSFM